MFECHGCYGVQHLLNHALSGNHYELYTCGAKLDESMTTSQRVCISIFRTLLASRGQSAPLPPAYSLGLKGEVTAVSRPSGKYV